MVFADLAVTEVLSKIQNHNQYLAPNYHKKLDIIATTDCEPYMLRCFINSIKAQTNKNYRLVLVSDDNNSELQNSLEIEGYLSSNVILHQSNVANGKYGHASRRYALNNLIESEYVMLTSGANYYAPTMVDDVLKRNEDFIYFSCIHSHLLPHIGNTDHYGILDSQLREAHIDMGCAAIRSSIAVSVGFNSDTFSADWCYFNEILNSGSSTYKVNRLLMIRN